MALHSQTFLSRHFGAELAPSPHWSRESQVSVKLDRPYTSFSSSLTPYRGLADYTDLLENWLRRLRSGEVAPSWRHVLVDEVQDLSLLQIELVRALLPASGEGFFGIGDPDQAIYGFRGAHPDVTGTFKEGWPALETITLEESYRSGQDILTSADALLGKASQSGRLRAARKLSSRLKLFTAPDGRREAAWMAEEIGRLLGATSHTLIDAKRASDPLAGTYSPGEIAVLVRMKALMAPIRDALFARGVPVAVPEAEPFWTEPRAALLLALAAKRFGRPAELGEDAPEVPESAWAGGPSTVLESLVSCPPFDPLFRDSEAFQSLRRCFEEEASWPALLDWICLRQELDLARESGEKVRIMTLHASKGLEFRAVFLPALEDGLLPYAGPAVFAPGADLSLGADAVAEERRLLYVGLTRAEEAVYASCAEKRRLYGKELSLPPSRFLDSLPDLFVRTKLVRHTKTERKQMSLF